MIWRYQVLLALVGIVIALCLFAGFAAPHAREVDQAAVEPIPCQEIVDRFRAAAPEAGGIVVLTGKTPEGNVMVVTRYVDGWSVFGFAPAHGCKAHLLGYGPEVLR